MAVISKTQRNAFNSCSTTLKSSLTSSSQTTGIILNALIRNKAVVAWPATSGGVLRFYGAGYEEFVGFGSATLDGDNNVTLVDVTRDLPWNNGASFTGAGGGRAWPAGTKVDLVLDARHMNKIAFQDLANTFTDLQTFSKGITLDGTTAVLHNVPLTTAERDALVGVANGAQIYNETVGQMQWYEGGTWVSNAAGGTVADASETVAGKSEIATTAEIRSEAATGGTGAVPVIPASATAVLKDDRVVLKDVTELTIASGAITVTQAYHTVDTESDAASDDLDTITAQSGAGEIIVLKAAHTDRTVVIKDGTGNILIPGGDFVLDDTQKQITLIYDGTNWSPVARPSAPDVPTGSLLMWSTATAPTGWLLCDGSAVSRTTYADLFGVISTTFGVGDGSTTFNVPDMRGRFPLGKDNLGGSSANRVTATEADNIGQASGAETKDISHVHTMTMDSDGPTGSGGEWGTTASSKATGGMSANNTPNVMNPYLTVAYIIKI